MTQVETGIIKALVYSDLFDYPMTSPEIVDRYVGIRPVAREVIGRQLNELVRKQLVEKEGNFYFLPGKTELVRVRKNRLRPSTQKLLRAKKVALKLAVIPWVKGIFLTGTAAVDNAQMEDDIDLMIVTKKNKLWSTRLVVTVYLELMGVRRRPNQEEFADNVCVNLLMDELNLAVPTRLRNLYTANEVVLAKCIYDRGGVAARFVQENRWVRDYLPNTVVPQIRKLKPSRKKGGWGENLSYWVQRKYMESKITREVISKQAAYFHPKDMAKIVLDRYNQASKNYGIK